MLVVFDRSMRSFDVDGRLHVASTNISKATVNPYFGREIPGYQQLGLDANRVYQMLRHPDELEKAASTFNNLPVLNLHAPTSAQDHREDLTVGTTGSDCAFDGRYLKCSLAIWTKGAIDDIESERKQELSCGYRFRPDMTPGVFEGKAYDGVMRDIVGNHVALVPEGRAGSDVCVHDQNPFEESKMKHGKFIAGLKANGLLAANADLVALDAAISAIAMDIDTDIWEDDPENPGYKRRKPGVMKKADESKKVTGDGALDNAAIVALIETETAKARTGMITQDELNTRLATAQAEATARVTQLFKAREEVKPVIGDCALDSADAVYKAALEKLGVTLDGVPTEAYGALFATHQKAAESRPANPFAIDQAARQTVREQMVEHIPGLARLVG